MDTISHERAEVLFDAARQFADPARRAAFLDQECGQELGLRRHVEELLALAAAADTFFVESREAVALPVTAARLVRDPAALPEALALGPLGEEPPGTRIGRYQLVRKLGEGGCGVVYLAAQEEPVRRQVALKIIKLGMETKSVIARFEAERQALAMMDHPNIARVFDAGATDRGPPYFVMELVRGEKITAYCDAHRLGVRERLDLFVQLCHAIQHAHQKGIIHGDIKPSNILVAAHDGAPVSKVIDFGIAKATEARLTDRHLFTAYAQLIGTPAYMSPEQAQMGGVDIDTRSDIYSLGVLLYELLTGRTPFDAKELLAAGLDELRRILREREPRRPSARLAALAPAELAATAASRRTEPHRLVARVRGDLDWIAMKALEKDRGRRYETANGLAMDVLRHLGHETVVARPPSWLYRLGKQVRRNRVAFIVGGTALLTLTAGFGTSTWMFFREREAHRRAVAAEQQQARLRQEAERRETITQAALLVSQERFGEADERLGNVGVAQPTMEGAAVFRSVGEWHAVNARWRQAADRFVHLLEVNQLEAPDLMSMDFLRCGPALLEDGDAAGYARFREQALERFAGAPAAFADRIVKIALLQPAPAELLQRMEPLLRGTSEALAASDANGDAFTAAWRSVAMGLAEYRRGNDPAAVTWCRRCLAYAEFNAPREATARLVLALALHRSGAADEARTESDAAREMVERKFQGPMDRGSPIQGFWFDWAFARILLREATAELGAPSADR